MNFLFCLLSASETSPPSSPLNDFPTSTKIATEDQSFVINGKLKVINRSVFPHTSAELDDFFAFLNNPEKKKQHDQIDSVVVCDMTFDYMFGETFLRFTKALEQLNSLQHLGFVGYFGTPWNEACKILVGFLPQYKSLANLSFQCTNVDDEAVKTLSMALPFCPALKALRFQQNNVGNEGAKALANVLPRCTSITEVNLHKNQIQDEGAKSLAEALPQCPSLKRLDLGYNYIGNAGAKSFLDTVSSLKHLNLEPYRISPYSKEIQEEIARKYPLKIKI